MIRKYRTGSTPVTGTSSRASKNKIQYRGVEQLVARRAHNPEVVWFKSHLRNQKSKVAHCATLLFCLWCVSRRITVSCEADNRSRLTSPQLTPSGARMFKVPPPQPYRVDVTDFSYIRFILSRFLSLLAWPLRLKTSLLICAHYCSVTLDLS